MKQSLRERFADMMNRNLKNAQEYALVALVGKEADRKRSEESAWRYYNIHCAWEAAYQELQRAPRDVQKAFDEPYEL